MESNTNIVYKEYSYRKETKDGKTIEKYHGFKRDGDQWFTLTEGGTWEPSTKEQALNTQHEKVQQQQSPIASDAKQEEPKAQLKDSRLRASRAIEMSLLFKIFQSTS